MIGVLLISQGKLAEGMYDTVKEELKEEVAQFDYLSFSDSFQRDLLRKINLLETGDGVVIFSDRLGSYPTNYASLLLSKGIHVVTGMNLSMILHFLRKREDGINFEALCQAGKDGVTHLNQILVLEPEVQYGS